MCYYAIIEKRFRVLLSYKISLLGEICVKIIMQLFWIILFSLLGEVVSVLIAPFVAIPASVIGMVLLFLALHYKVLKMSQVEEVGTWLTDNMAILFVPAGVGLMTNFDVLASSWLQLLIIMFVTTILMMIFVGKLVQSLMHKNNQSESEDE